MNTNIKEQEQQTTGLILRLSNNIQLLSIGVIFQRSFVSENGCLLFTSLPFMDNNSLARQTRRIAKNTFSFSRAAVGRMR